MTRRNSPHKHTRLGKIFGSNFIEIKIKGEDNLYKLLFCSRFAVILVGHCPVENYCSRLIQNPWVVLVFSRKCLLNVQRLDTRHTEESVGSFYSKIYRRKVRKVNVLVLIALSHCL